MHFQEYGCYSSACTGQQAAAVASYYAAAAAAASQNYSPYLNSNSPYQSSVTPLSGIYRTSFAFLTHITSEILYIIVFTDSSASDPVSPGKSEPSNRKSSSEGNLLALGEAFPSIFLINNEFWS